MERWYIGFETRVSSIDLSDRLGRLVRQHRLGDFITRVCYEIQEGNKSYYYFIGVISDEKDYIPQEKHRVFYNMLKELRLYDLKIYVYYDQIQHMVSKEVESFNFRQIKMAHLNKYLREDPFDFTTTTKESAYLEGDPKPVFNKLLFCLSAYGRGTWQQFQTMCVELGIDSTGKYARRVVRRLRSLGHIELSRDGRNWFVTPPCLVQLESKDQQYQVFLAGQRSSRLLETLQQQTYVMTTAQPYRNAPEQVLVTFSNESMARAFADDYSRQHHPIYLAGYAGLKMANILPSLDEWEATLPILSIVKGNYSFERWANGEFESLPLPQETGMYRLTHNSKRFEHPQLTLYYNAETDTWRRADWYGVRFLTLQRTETSTNVHYDSARHELAIALEQRWPDLYERSLVLASGQLPSFRNDHAIYNNISATQAHILADKLGVNLTEHGEYKHV